MIRLPKIKLGGATGPLAEWRRRLEWASNPDGSGGVTVSRGASGPVFRAPADGRRYVRLSGTTSPYTGTTVQPAAGGTWTNVPGDPSLSNLYETNGAAGLNGKVVRARPWGGEWRFQYVRSGAASCSITVSVTLFRVCNGQPQADAARLNGTVVRVKSGGTTVGTLAGYTHGGTNNITFTGPAGSYTIEYTLPAPLGFTRTTTATLACGVNNVTANFVTLLTVPVSIDYAIVFGGSLFDVNDVPGSVTITNPVGASGSWGAPGPLTPFTPTSDIDDSTLAGSSISVTYKGCTIGAVWQGTTNCHYSDVRFLDGVGITTAALPGCVTPVPNHAYTTHGISGTSDANGQAIINLPTAEVYNATTNPCVYNICV